MGMQILAPGGEELFQFDWASQIPEGVTLESVAHSVPEPLVLLEQSTDAPNSRSSIKLGAGTAKHGELYNVDAMATLSNTEKVPGSFPIRIFS